jgi:hypothetical protein
MNGVFKKLKYSALDARQKENFNFQWISGALATYGYHTHRVPDDWQGADLIARHMKSGRHLNIQLKGRMHFGRKYIGKKIWIAFRHGEHVYCYPHDKLLKQFEKINPIRIKKAWRRSKPEVHWNNPTKLHMKLLKPYQIDLTLA